MKRDEMEARLAQLLEDSGLPADEAAQKAAHSVDALRTAARGTTYGHLHPSDLAEVWKKAARAGRRRLVLEIVNEADDLDEDAGRISAKVLDAENWPTWTDEHAIQRAATDALLEALSPAPAPLDLAHRAAHSELYDDGEVTQLAPGVFLVPAELSEVDLMARGLGLSEVNEAEARARAEKLN